MQDPSLDPARLVFDEVAIWDPLRCPVPLERLTEGCSGEDERFIALAFRLAESFYNEQKPRNNGEPAFTHPTNVALILKLAAAQPHVIAAGLLHDLLEDMLDREKERRGHAGPDAEAACRARFAEDVIRITERAMFPRHIADKRKMDDVHTLQFGRIVTVVDTDGTRYNGFKPTKMALIPIAVLHETPFTYLAGMSVSPPDFRSAD